MREIHQDGVNARTIELESAGVESWPARETLELDGWLLRFTDGYTHRGNSVATHRYAGNQLGVAIEQVEHEYRARAIRPMFQISPAASPVDLERILRERGYATITPTLTCVASSLVMRASLPEPREVHTSGEPEEDFIALLLAGSRSEADGHERLDILSRIELPHICVTAYDKGVAVACGTGTLCKGWVGINMMRTALEHRRSGHAQRVLSAIARWSDGKGVSRLYLNVEQANYGARALYTKAGFETAYEYRYSVLEQYDSRKDAKPQSA
jgi:GNAT superfamily N-acetyltransferase